MYLIKRKILLILIFISFPVLIISQTNSISQPEIFNKESLQGERIFFIKKYNLGEMRIGDIYSVKSDGTDLQRLTNFSENYAGTELPQLSGDGTKLAFISNFESWKSCNYIDAFMADFITGKITRITGHEKFTQTTRTGTVNVTVNDPKGYALTPSAIRISYSGCSNFVTGNSAILTIPAGEEIWIKAEVAKAKGDIQIVTVPEGGNINVALDLTRGTLSAESCSPSYDGKYLAVSENSEAVSNDAGETFAWYKILIWDSNSRTELTEVGGMKQGGDITPAFSQNDAYLAFCTGEQAVHSLGVVPTSNLSQTPSLIAYGNILGYHAYCTNPVWSPDGQEIVYVYVILTTTWYGTEIKSNLYKVPANGGDPVQITFLSGREVASKPSYSPDGSKIAFTHSVSNGNIFTLSDYITGNYSSNISAVPSSGGNITSITNDDNSMDPSWGIVGNPVGIESVNELLPSDFVLEQNYPNPFNPATKIKYSIPGNHSSSQYVSLKIFDALGKEIASLVNEFQKPGFYEVEFNAENLSSGIYFYRLDTQSFHQTKKMILIK